MNDKLGHLRHFLAVVLAIGIVGSATTTLAQPPIKPPFAPPRRPAPPKRPTSPKIPDQLKSLFSGSDQQRLEALEQLRDKGPVSPETLSKLLGDENPLLRLESLSSIDSGSTVTPEMLQQLQQRLQQSDSPLEKILAASAMLRTSSEQDQGTSTDALAALDQALNSGDDAQANEAANALRRIGGRSTPVLTKALASPSTSVRRLAVDALRQIGPDAGAATSPLVNVLRRDTDSGVRAIAARAAASTTNDPAGTAKGLAESLRSASPETSAAIAGALADIGQPAVEPLVALLSDSATRYWSVLALSEIGPGAKAAEQPLVKLLGTATPDVTTEVLIALPKIGASNPETVSKVSTLLRESDQDMRYAATFAIAKMGVKSEQADATLRRNLGDEDLFLKAMSAWAIVKTNPGDRDDAVELMKTLGEMAQAQDARVKKIAVLMLSDLSSQVPK